MEGSTRQNTDIGAWCRVLFLGRRPRKTLIRATVLAVVSFALFSWVAQPMYIHGISMEPTYQDGSFRLINLLRYRFREPARGDIVVITLSGRRTMYMKRILALPGETVCFQKGQLIVDGQIIPEPYVIKAGHWNTAPELLRAGEYFVAGDNRDVAQEQHVMGVVDRSRIAGSVLF